MNRLMVKKYINNLYRHGKKYKINIYIKEIDQVMMIHKKYILLIILQVHSSLKKHLLMIPYQIMINHKDNIKKVYLIKLLNIYFIPYIDLDKLQVD